MMNEYLKHIGEETHKIGEIKENPDKSKNLQTATFPVFGISIDVNNLRTETYADDSRTPEMVPWFFLGLILHFTKMR